eukprot:sb/3472953/
MGCVSTYQDTDITLLLNIKYDIMEDESVQLEIVPLDEEGEAVFFKEDGGRFDTPQTLKLMVDTKYTLRVYSKKDFSGSDILINGDILQLIPGERQEEGRQQVYSVVFNTGGIEKTKRADRSVLAVQIPTLPSGILVSGLCRIEKERESKVEIIRISCR